MKQYVEEQANGGLTIRLHAGADGSFLQYEDDGRSFDYRKGQWMGKRMAWNDTQRTLNIRLEKGSRILAPARRELVVCLGDRSKPATFDVKPVTIRF